MNIRIIIFIIVSVGITGVASLGITWNPYANKNRPSPDRYNYFDAELLEVLTRHDDGNVLISPLAVKIALEMLMDGAIGRSADEIRNALRLNNEENSDRKELHQQNLYPILMGTMLKIATKVFVSDGYQINSNYQMALKKKFGSDITHVRFQKSQEITRIINNWVTNATSGLVNKLVDEGSIDPETKLMLANVVYFKGKWLHPFSKENTIIKCFKTENEECKRVPMMTESTSYEYAYIAKLDAEAINIPYDGNQFSILLLLPKKVNGCRQLCRDLIHVSLEEIISELRQQEIYVEIPKFTVESSKDLRPHLQKLQILQVFSSRADLSRIFANSKESVLVNKILHSAKLEVNEEGTEAAAAIGSLFVPLMGGSPTAFIADHPFLFFIRDTRTGTVLFSGKIEQPDIEERQNFFTSGNKGSSVEPREGSKLLPEGSKTEKEVEMNLNQERQLSTSSFQTRNDRHHVRMIKGKMKNVRKSNYQDAISFDNAKLQFDYHTH